MDNNELNNNTNNQNSLDAMYNANPTIPNGGVPVTPSVEPIPVVPSQPVAAPQVAPVTPEVAPVVPVAPAVPGVNPVEAAPVNPTAPVAPVNPVEAAPVNPTAPVAPVNPATPNTTPATNNTSNNPQGKTKVCPGCKEVVPKSTKKCPKCGKSLGLPTWAKILIIVGVVFLVLTGCVVGVTVVGYNKIFKHNDKVVKEVWDNMADEYKDVNGKSTFKLKESFQNRRAKITMLSYKKNYKPANSDYKPKSGKKYVKVKCQVENVSDTDEELHVSSSTFAASVDGNSITETYIPGEKTLTASLTKGAKVVGNIIYEVPENFKKLELSYNPNFLVDGITVKFIITE